MPSLTNVKLKSKLSNMNQGIENSQKQRSEFPRRWWEFPLTLLVTVLIALVGWSYTGYLSSERDRINKQREVTTQYLIEAYRQIEIVCARDNKEDISIAMIQGLESAIADIQLFGSVKQIELARRVVKEIENASYSDPRYLLIELRTSLRSELELEALSTDSSDIMHFRIWETFPDSEKNDSL